MKRAINARWWLVACLLFVGALVPYIWFGFNLHYVSTDNETDYSVPSQVIIVLGCPSYEGNIPSDSYSGCVQARAHQAADLYHRGLAPYIIPTGGMTGPPPTEATAMSEVMQADGVPASAIFLEEQARSTVGNIQYSRAIMQANGWETAILVTDPHHIKRAAFIARDAGLNITTSPATTSAGWHTPSARQHNLWHDARHLMTYQFNRLFSGPP